MSNLKKLSENLAQGFIDGMTVHASIFRRPNLSKITAITSLSRARPSVEEALASDWKAIGGDIRSATRIYSIKHAQKSK